MPLFNIFLSFCWIGFVSAYRNNLFTIAKFEKGRTREYKCAVYEGVTTESGEQNADENSSRITLPMGVSTQKLQASMSGTVGDNPFEVYQNYLHKFLYGDEIEMDEPTTRTDNKILGHQENNASTYRHYVVGNYMRSELFNNRSGVHLPLAEYIHRGYCELKITKDYMQTAVNAFAIFLHGTLDDIERLPADYVLRSARTISMMKIAREKLAATWGVVKAGRATMDISHLTLEMYRPLFKYINGREIARLNLSDERILTYIGTHAELDRHQVGVVASKYIELNKDWSRPRYLNIMNNLLCGVPMTFMRRLPVSTYLQLSHQSLLVRICNIQPFSLIDSKRSLEFEEVFYHIRACDPLQRRFYLAMMTRTKALGKSFSWNARDVSRLGLLLTEVEGTDLSAVNPQAMAGITAQVMLQMSPQTLQYLSENQLKYLGPKPLNILARKLKKYYDQLQIYDSAYQTKSDIKLLVIKTFILHNFKYYLESFFSS